MTVTTGLDQLLFDLGEVWTNILAQVPVVWDTITSHPIGILGFGVIFTYTIVKVAKRFF